MSERGPGPNDALFDRFAEVGAETFAELGGVSSRDDAILERMIDAGLTAAPVAGAGAASGASKLSVKLLAGLGVGTAVVVVTLVLVAVRGEPAPAPAVEVDPSPPARVVEVAPEPEPEPEPEVAEAAASSEPAEASAREPSPTVEPERAVGTDRGGAKGQDEGESAAELLLAANRARRQGEHERARDLYRALGRRFPGSREHLISRVALGDLELTHFERPKPALAEYEAYLKAKPRGNLAEEALHGKARALDRLGRESAATQAWTQLLERFPSSLHAPAAKRRLDVR